MELYDSMARLSISGTRSSLVGISVLSPSLSNFSTAPLQRISLGWRSSPTGGIVGEILAKEGSSVEAGDIVMRLDDTVTRSTLGVVRSQLDELLAREARLSAERDSAEMISFSEDLLARAVSSLRSLWGSVSFIART